MKSCQCVCKQIQRQGQSARSVPVIPVGFRELRIGADGKCGPEESGPYTSRCAACIYPFHRDNADITFADVALEVAADDLQQFENR